MNRKGCGGPTFGSFCAACKGEPGARAWAPPQTPLDPGAPLLSCPFCGQCDASIEATEPHGALVVECKCGAKGPEAPCQAYLATSQESYEGIKAEASAKAVRFWNTRMP